MVSHGDFSFTFYLLFTYCTSCSPSASPEWYNGREAPSVVRKRHCIKGKKKALLLQSNNNAGLTSYTNKLDGLHFKIDGIGMPQRWEGLTVLHNWCSILPFILRRVAELQTNSVNRKSRKMYLVNVWFSLTQPQHSSDTEKNYSVNNNRLYFQSYVMLTI